MSKKIDEVYLKYTQGGFTPHIYQEKLYKALSKGRSVVGIFPTGSGKTEGVLFPFLENEKNMLPGKMVIGLPLRTLVNSIGERMKEYAALTGKKAYILHGQNPENPLFERDITATTIDQFFCGLNGIPLSVSNDSGNLVGGSLISSFAVFDEAHMLSEKDGFQALLRLIDVYHSLKMPVCLLSATIPSQFANYLRDRYDFEVVAATDESKIPTRSGRSVQVTYVKDQEITVTDIMDAYNASEESIIVIVNNVERAKNFYFGASMALGEEKVFLFHSEFKESDRKTKEEIVARYFGKKRTETDKIILIATQVIEAGMDISTPFMLTELATIDALVQRVGRVARWGGSGKVIVYDKKSARPYDQTLVDHTSEALHLMYGGRFAPFTWKTEQMLVDQIMGPHFEKFVEDESFLLKNMLQANNSYVDSDKSGMQKIVRDISSCSISICANPEKYGRDLLFMEKVGVSPGKLQNYMQSKGLSGYRLEYSENEEGFLLMEMPKDVVFEPNAHYILSPYNIGYSPDIGLYFDDTITPTLDFEINKKLREAYTVFEYEREPFSEHFRRTYEHVYDLLSFEHVFLRKIAKRYRYPFRKIRSLLAFIFALHDLGKLTEAFQNFALSEEGEFLAHFNKKSSLSEPLQHAFVSAMAIEPLLRSLKLPRGLYLSLMTAIKYHHRVNFDALQSRLGERIVGYRFKNGYDEELKRAVWSLPKKLKKELICNLGPEFLSCLDEIKSESNVCIRTNLIDLSDDEELVSLYLFFSYMVIAADRGASGEVSIEKEINCGVFRAKNRRSV